MSGDGILAQLRVLDFAGPALTYAGRMFADLGADVILVEPPTGAPARQQPPLVETLAGPVVSAHFAFMAAGKRSVAVDISTEPGHAVLERLVASSDVALAPDTVDEQRAARLRPDDLRRFNEQLVVTSVTGFGDSGPRRHWRSSDLIGWATSGAMYSMGNPGRAPLAPGGGLAHTAGALNAALGTMVALRARNRRGGRGQAVDISLQEAVLSVAMEAGPLFALEGGMQIRGGQRRMAAHGMFPVKDGNVEVVAFLPTQWDAMAQWISEELGVEEATSDAFRGPTARYEFHELIEAWMFELASRYTKQEFFLEAQRRHIPCGAINTAADLLDDPQLAAVDAWATVSHPEVDELRIPRAPVRFDGVRAEVGAVPALGEHTVTVLRDLLGYSADEIEALLVSGIAAAPDLS